MLSSVKDAENEIGPSEGEERMPLLLPVAMAVAVPLLVLVPVPVPELELELVLALVAIEEAYPVAVAKDEDRIGGIIGTID